MAEDFNDDDEGKLITTAADDVDIAVCGEEDNQTLRNPEERLPRSRLSILEPVVFLVYFATSLSETIYESEVIYQTCYVTFGYNESDCNTLGTDDATDESKIIEAQVQQYAASVLMTRSLIGGILPAIGSIFIGPFSDKVGRKPIILVALIGYCSIYVILSVIAFLSTKISISPWFYIIPWIPVSVSGGDCAFTTGAFSYISDITNNSNRPLRMSFLEAAIYLGYVIGSLLSSFILHATDSTIIFAISAFSILSAICYTNFLVKESLNPSEMDPTVKFYNMFKWKFVKDTMRTCFEKRPKYNRTVIWLMITSLVLTIFASQGSDNIFYLFVRERFSWNIRDYTLYDSGEILTQVVGNIVGMYLLRKVLQLPVTVVALFAFASSTIDAVIKASAKYTWHLYLAIGAGLLKGITGPMCHTILSSVIPPQDVGKIYSLTTAIESISPMGSAPLYANVYSETLRHYAGAFNIISAVVYFICYILVAIVFSLERSNDVVQVN